MSTLIPNENCWIGFSPTMPASATLAPTEAEISACTELTEFFISLTANATGNTVPIPSLKSLFEKSIPGTSTAQFTGELYRDEDDAKDTAWNTLPRDTQGVFYVSRFGGTGTGKKPLAGDKVEVWPVRVTTRAGSAMTSNTAQTFSLTCSVPDEPNEDAVVLA